jgi:hypothetical protein
MAVIVSFTPPAATLNRKLSGRRNRSGSFWSRRESNYDSSDDSFCKQPTGIKFCRRHEASRNLTQTTRDEVVMDSQRTVLNVITRYTCFAYLVLATRLHVFPTSLTTPGDDYEKPTPGNTSKAQLLCFKLPFVSHQNWSDSESTVYNIPGMSEWVTTYLPWKPILPAYAVWGPSWQIFWRANV